MMIFKFGGKSWRESQVSLGESESCVGGEAGKSFSSSLNSDVTSDAIFARIFHHSFLRHYPSSAWNSVRVLSLLMEFLPRSWGESFSSRFRFPRRVFPTLLVEIITSSVMNVLNLPLPPATFGFPTRDSKQIHGIKPSSRSGPRGSEPSPGEENA